LAYYDGDQMHLFYGTSEGTLAHEKKGSQQAKAKSDLWYIFVPRNHNKTLAEMSDDERNNRCDERTSAIRGFIEWYKEKNKEYIKK
jgi:XTP/dITP diphosphohydrolase